MILLDAADPASAAGWGVVTDQVMGGVSTAAAAIEALDGETALRLSGDVRLDNDGGFIQIARMLGEDGGLFDASGYAALALRVFGDGAEWDVRLRTDQLDRQWQSYRAGFHAPAGWSDVVLPLDAFAPHRTTTPLDLRRLRRIGLLSIGSARRATIGLAQIALTPPPG